MKISFQTRVALLGLLLNGLTVKVSAQAGPASDQPTVQILQPTVDLVLHFASEKPVESITLLNLDGKPVFEGQPTGDQISVAGLAPGTYVAVLKVGHHSVVRKVRVG